MKHTHAHSHRVGHPSGAGGGHTVEVTHTHEHAHGSPNADLLHRGAAPAHGGHTHDAKNDPHAQARREWREASRKAGSVMR